MSKHKKPYNQQQAEDLINKFHGSLSNIRKRISQLKQTIPELNDDYFKGWHEIEANLQEQFAILYENENDDRDALKAECEEITKAIGVAFRNDGQITKLKTQIESTEPLENAHQALEREKAKLQKLLFQVTSFNKNQTNQNHFVDKGNIADHAKNSRIYLEAWFSTLDKGYQKQAKANMLYKQTLQMLKAIENPTPQVQETLDNIFVDDKNQYFKKKALVDLCNFIIPEDAYEMDNIVVRDGESRAKLELLESSQAIFDDFGLKVENENIIPKPQTKNRPKKQVKQPRRQSAEAKKERAEEPLKQKPKQTRTTRQVPSPQPKIYKMSDQAKNEIQQVKEKFANIKDAINQLGTLRDGRVATEENEKYKPTEQDIINNKQILKDWGSVLSDMNSYAVAAIQDLDQQQQQQASKSTEWLNKITSLNKEIDGIRTGLENRIRTYTSDARIADTQRLIRDTTTSLKKHKRVAQSFICDCINLSNQQRTDEQKQEEVFGENSNIPALALRARKHLDHWMEAKLSERAVEKIKGGDAFYTQLDKLFTKLEGYTQGEENLKYFKGTVSFMKDMNPKVFANLMFMQLPSDTTKIDTMKKLLESNGIDYQSLLDINATLLEPEEVKIPKETPQVPNPQPETPKQAQGLSLKDQQKLDQLTNKLNKAVGQMNGELASNAFVVAGTKLRVIVNTQREILDLIKPGIKLGKPITPEMQFFQNINSALNILHGKLENKTITLNEDFTLPEILQTSITDNFDYKDGHYILTKKALQWQEFKNVKDLDGDITLTERPKEVEEEKKVENPPQLPPFRERENDPNYNHYLNGTKDIAARSPQYILNMAKGRLNNLEGVKNADDVKNELQNELQAIRDSLSNMPTLRFISLDEKLEVPEILRKPLQEGDEIINDSTEELGNFRKKVIDEIGIVIVKKEHAENPQNQPKASDKVERQIEGLKNKLDEVAKEVSKKRTDDIYSIIDNFKTLLDESKGFVNQGLLRALNDSIKIPVKYLNDTEAPEKTEEILGKYKELIESPALVSMLDGRFNVICRHRANYCDNRSKLNNAEKDKYQNMADQYRLMEAQISIAQEQRSYKSMRMGVSNLNALVYASLDELQQDELQKFNEEIVTARMHLEKDSLPMAGLGVLADSLVKAHEAVQQDEIAGDKNEFEKVGKLLAEFKDNLSKWQALEKEGYNAERAEFFDSNTVGNPYVTARGLWDQLRENINNSSEKTVPDKFFLEPDFRNKLNAVNNAMKNAIKNPNPDKEPSLESFASHVCSAASNFLYIPVFAKIAANALYCVAKMTLFEVGRSAFKAPTGLMYDYQDKRGFKERVADDYKAGKDAIISNWESRPQKTAEDYKQEWKEKRAKDRIKKEGEARREQIKEQKTAKREGPN